MRPGFLALLLCAGVAQAAEDTACLGGRNDDPWSIDYAVEGGFAPNETFIRRWIRDAPDRPMEVPTYYEQLAFKGTAFSYSYQLDDRHSVVPTGADGERFDAVNHLKGSVFYGAEAYVGLKTGEAPIVGHAGCNTAVDAKGTCRANISSAEGSGFGLNPAISLFFTQDTVRDVCFRDASVGSTVAQLEWWITLDGVRGIPSTDDCLGAEAAAAVLAADRIEVTVIADKGDMAGKAVTHTIPGESARQLVALMSHMRRLSYEPTPEQAAWLAALVEASKAIFKTAGEKLRDCQPGEG